MRKLMNRKGSTLALTIIIFAVLMIFATFTLGFMVTENKQAMYHQNKTQAYYIAKSGAEVVEEALKTQLYTYEDNHEAQLEFINQFDDGVEVDVDIDNLTDKVLVKNETYNGKKIMTIESKANFNGVDSRIKKGMYSILSVVNQTEENEYIPGSGELFVVLGDDKPVEYYGSNKSGMVPESYYNIVAPEDRAGYLVDPLPTVSESDWLKTNGIIINGKITTGTYSSEEKNIYVDGSLELSGNITINGDMNIYVRDTLLIRNSTFIMSDTYTTETGKKYRLNIYVYNTNSSTVSVSTDASADIGITGNLFVANGDISIEVHQSGYIDGHIVYTGDGEIKFSSHSNNFTTNKLLTGSIYAPEATVSLGFHTYKTANIIGGQVIAKKIDVYSNNKTQAGKFYSNSTKNRENNSIPVKVSQTINHTSISYGSFFID